MLLKNLLESPSHHVYIIYNEPISGLKTNIAEDFHVIEKKEGITMGDMEWIYKYSMFKSDTKKRQVIIYTPSITTQAQNALLKVLEDLGESVFFFFCLPEGTHILDTFISRCVVLFQKEGNSKLSEEFEKFIELPIKERISVLNNIWDLGEQGRYETILSFVQNLELYIHKNIMLFDYEHTNSCKKIVSASHQSIVGGAMHKTTFQLFAFI